MTTMDETGLQGRAWPGWARGLASLALAFHLAAMVAAALAVAPSSMLERGVAGLFAGYYGLIDQGYSYRFYAPEPPPTPVIEARLHFHDGRPDRSIRIPDRATRPRMLYQRELALANHLYVEHAGRRDLPEEARRPELWGPSYARHLGRVHGCDQVSLFARLHLIPPRDEVRRRLDRGEPIDLDADEFTTDPPDLIGVYPCDGS
jgi:hypothetical protein